MKHYKGKLHDYFATGEMFHYYVWTGDPSKTEHNWENHLMLTESDVVEVSSPAQKERIIIHYFPRELEDLKKLLGKKGFKVWVQAAKENWDIEVVKFVYDRNPH